MYEHAHLNILSIVTLITSTCTFYIKINKSIAIVLIPTLVLLHTIVVLEYSNDGLWRGDISNDNFMAITQTKF